MGGAPGRPGDEGYSACDVYLVVLFVQLGPGALPPTTNRNKKVKGKGEQASKIEVTDPDG